MLTECLPSAMLINSVFSFKGRYLSIKRPYDY